VGATAAITHEALYSAMLLKRKDIPSVSLQASTDLDELGRPAGFDAESNR
jgi:hypothetical protein